MPKPDPTTVTDVLMQNSHPCPETSRLSLSDPCASIEHMFDTASFSPLRGPAAARVGELAGQLRDLEAVDARECVDLLDQLERLKATAAAAQARVTAALDRTRQEQAEARRAADPGPSRRANPDAGLGSEIGLARHESPHRGRGFLRLSRALTHDLPETMAALDRGDINERRAEIIARETGDLTREQRLAADRELAPQLPELGDVELLRAARRIVIRIDEAGYLERRARAFRNRKVGSRGLGDGVSQLSGVLASEVSSTIMLSLGQAADRLRAAGDERSRSQLVADLFAERLLGSVFATAAPIALKLVMTAETLVGDDDEPADLVGHGPVPASVARNLVQRGIDSTVSTLQRLFSSPSGALVAMESESRVFRGQLRQFIELRDPICRTPYCNAPVRHADHVVSKDAGGETSTGNGQGLCEGCNYAKESVGFRHRTVPGPRHTVEITTPTGHVHRSRSPGVPVRQPDRLLAEPIEIDVFWAA